MKYSLLKVSISTIFAASHLQEHACLHWVAVHRRHLWPCKRGSWCSLGIYLSMSPQRDLGGLGQLCIRLLRMIAMNCSRCKACSYIVSGGGFLVLQMLGATLIALWASLLGLRPAPWLRHVAALAEAQPSAASALRRRNDGAKYHVQLLRFEVNSSCSHQSAAQRRSAFHPHFLKLSSVSST